MEICSSHPHEQKMTLENQHAEVEQLETGVLAAADILDQYDLAQDKDLRRRILEDFEFLLDEMWTMGYTRGCEDCY